MTRAIFRTLWRILVFTLGGILIWLVVFFFVPIVDSRLPVFVALLGAYVLLAYIVIPNLIRLFRIIIKPNHIPLYATSGDGWPSDPVNIAIIVPSKSSLITAMNAAGWYQADPMTFRNSLRGLRSYILNTAYPEAPFSSLYLFGRKQDIGFEISTNRSKSMRTRHHVRFWKLEEPKMTDQDKHPHVSFWQQKLHNILLGKNEIWIGAATEDIFPLDIQWYTGRLSHGVSHDSDRERDFIIQSLQKKKLIKRIHTTSAGETVKFRGQQFRTIYITDGSIKVVRLR